MVIRRWQQAGAWLPFVVQKRVNDMGNPRSANGNLRRKHRARLKAIGGECGICRGRLGPIHYDEPSDSDHPLSFVIDEIKPVSRWREFGYASKEAAAKGNKTMKEVAGARKKNDINIADGLW